MATQAGSGDIGDGGGDDFGHPFLGAIFRDGSLRKSFIGYLDTFRVSDNARYSGNSFTAPTGDLTDDANTVVLFNFAADDITFGQGAVTVADLSGNMHTGTFGAGFPDATSPRLPGTIDVDDTGSITPLTDGLLVLRYLFGFTGTTLTAGAVGGGCGRCDAASIHPYISSLLGALDVDADGTVGAADRRIVDPALPVRLHRHRAHQRSGGKRLRALRRRRHRQPTFKGSSDRACGSTRPTCRRFPTRVRLLIYAKGLDVEMVRPSGFHGDGAEKGSYFDVNPIGRVPTLELDDGWTLPESEVICEYLEDAYPEPSLRPTDPKLRARMRLLSRISDIYMVRALSPLWNIVVRPPKEWDQDLIRAALEEVDQALGYVDAFIGDQGYAVGDSITQADGTLIPILVLVEHWLPIFRGPALLPRHPKTAEYWRRIADDPLAARLIAETRDALEEAMGRRSRAKSS